VSTGAKEQYLKADACFRKLRGMSPTENTRREWMLCIGRFHNAYLEEPAGPLAAQSLYQEGILYQDLHKRLKFDSDLRAARENFEKIVAEFSDNPYAAKAAKELSPCPRRSAGGAARWPPPAPLRAGEGSPSVVPVPDLRGPQARTRRGRPCGGSGPAPLVNPNYTRVVVYLIARQTSFTTC
jgi:hypothetical protein